MYHVSTGSLRWVITLQMEKAIVMPPLPQSTHIASDLCRCHQTLLSHEECFPKRYCASSVRGKWNKRAEESEKEREKEIIKSSAVAFAVSISFDFPEPSLLMAPWQHETWHIIHYSVRMSCRPTQLHMAHVVSRHPNPFPAARGCFVRNRDITPLPQRDRVATESRRSKRWGSCLRVWQTLDNLTV